MYVWGEPYRRENAEYHGGGACQLDILDRPTWGCEKLVKQFPCQ